LSAVTYKLCLNFILFILVFTLLRQSKGFVPTRERNWKDQWDR